MDSVYVQMVIILMEIQIAYLVIQNKDYMKLNATKLIALMVFGLQVRNVMMEIQLIEMVVPNV